MSLAVSIVVPTLDDPELLDLCLGAVFAERDRRGVGDEVLVVDDSGEGAVVEHLREHFPEARTEVHERNLGFPAALERGVRTAHHALVLALNPDVELRPGAIDPLVETLGQGGTRAVAPLVIDGDGRLSEESLPRIVVEGGLPRVVCAELDVTPGAVCAAHPEGIPVDFCLGGAFLFRRTAFLQQPFDPRFEPFYWEDVDWGAEARGGGETLRVDPRAVAVHRNRGTIAPRVPESLRRAAIEKNRLLYAWKHFEGEALREHLEVLSKRLVECALTEERDELVAFLLATETRNDARRSIWPL